MGDSKNGASEHILSVELDTFYGRQSLKVMLKAGAGSKPRAVFLPCQNGLDVREWAEEARAVFDEIAPRAKGRPRRRRVAIQGDQA